MSNGDMEATINLIERMLVLLIKDNKPLYKKLREEIGDFYEEEEARD